jgi:hypothetical protein
MKTEDLIVGLARDLRPVRRLRHPWLRATMWVAATILYLAGIVLFMAPPGRLGAAVVDLRFLFEQLAAGLVGLTAGGAALATVVPGYTRRVFIAPIAASVLWIGLVTIGGVQDVLRHGATGIPLQTDWPCVTAIVMTGALPAVALVYMLRRGAPLTPRMTLALAVLSAAALANVSACLVRPHETSITVLLWHGTTVLALCGVAGLLGTSVLKWTWPSTHLEGAQP